MNASRICSHMHLVYEFRKKSAGYPIEISNAGGAVLCNNRVPKMTMAEHRHFAKSNRSALEATPNARGRGPTELRSDTHATKYLPHAFWHELCFWFQHSAQTYVAKQRAAHLSSQLDRSTHLPAKVQTKNNAAVKNSSISLISLRLCLNLMGTNGPYHDWRCGKAREALVFLVQELDTTLLKERHRDKIESSDLPSQKSTDFGMHAVGDTFGMSVPCTAVKFQNRATLD